VIPSIVVSRAAQIQIETAVIWFFEKKQGLEKAFLLELDKGMHYIQKNPSKCQIRYKTVRIKFLKKFEFGIHYIFNEQPVYVLAVFHTKQNSDDWLQ
jgi:plasmid stabilization system protein ParE